MALNNLLKQQETIFPSTALTFNDYSDTLSDSNSRLMLARFNNPLFQQQLTPFDQKAIYMQLKAMQNNDRFNNVSINNLNRVDKILTAQQRLQQQHERKLARGVETINVTGISLNDKNFALMKGNFCTKIHQIGIFYLQMVQKNPTIKVCVFVANKLDNI